MTYNLASKVMFLLQTVDTLRGCPLLTCSCNAICSLAYVPVDGSGPQAIQALSHDLVGQSRGSRVPDELQLHDMTYSYFVQ